MTNNKLKFKILGFLKENWPFILILLLAIFLRFYNIGDYLHFANDEARDAYVVKDIIEADFFKLTGPSTTIGNFNLGPFFYYFLAPFYLLFNFNPVAGGVAVALLDLFTISLLYFFTKKHFLRSAAILATLLYVASFWINFYERWGWNPNILPFFTILTLWLCSKLYFSRGRWPWYYLIGSGIVVGLALQAHAQAVWLGVLVVVVLALRKGSGQGDQSHKGDSGIAKLGHGLIFFLTAWLMNLPLLIFEVKTGGQNGRAIINWLMDTREKTVLSSRIIDSFTEFANFSSQLVMGHQQFVWFVILLFLVPSLYLVIVYSGRWKNFWRAVDRKDFLAIKILLILVILILFSFLLISEKKYFHFFMILLPVIPIYLGFILAKICQQSNRLLRLLVILLFISVVSLNFVNTLNYWQQLEEGNRIGKFDLPLKDMRAATEYIASDSSQFVVVDLAGMPSEDRAFEYLLEQNGNQLISGCSHDYTITRGSSGTGQQFGRLEVLEER